MEWSSIMGVAAAPTGADDESRDRRRRLAAIHLATLVVAGLLAGFSGADLIDGGGDLLGPLGLTIVGAALAVYSSWSIWLVLTAAEQAAGASSR